MKSFVEAMVHRPVTALMIVCGIVLLGTVSLDRLPVGLLPNLASPGITVITRWPGVAAQKIDETLTVPLERQVSDIPGLERIQSVSSEGESRIHLIFAHDVDIKSKIIEATERIGMIRDSFPREVEEPYSVQYDPSDKPVFIVSFASDVHDLKRLREIVDRSAKIKFEQIDGVSEIFVGGGFEREIQVITDPGRLAAHGMSSGPVTQAVAEGNVFVPGGRPAASQERNIYADAKFRSVEEIRETLVAGAEGKLVRLSQVADVRDLHRERDTIAKTNGEERVTIYVEKSGNANTLWITEKCAAIASTLSLPGVRYHVTYDQGEKIRSAVGRVIEACITGSVIVMLVLYAFLGRLLHTFVVVLSLPVSIFATFLFMFLSGLEINVMTLSGIALGSGMLIDNSIVVSESIQSHAERRGVNALQAVVNGTSAVFAEVTAATLCAIVVLIPLLFTDPETRRLYFGFCATVACALLFSLLTSLSLTPAFLYAVMLRTEALPTRRPPGTMTIPEFATFVRKAVGRRLHLGLGSRTVFSWISIARSEASVDRLVRRYRLLARTAFRRPRVVFGIALLVLLLAPLAFHSLEKEYFDPADSGDIEATVDLETGTDLNRTEQIVGEIESDIRQSPLVREVSAKIEKWHATLNIRLADQGKRKGLEFTMNDLKNRTGKAPGAFVYFAGADEGGVREFDIDFYGDDLVVLKKFAGDVSARLKAEIPGVDEAVLRFREPKGEILIRPSPVNLARAGATVSDLGLTVRNFLSGAVITKFYDREREVDVRFRAPGTAFDTPEKLESMVLPFRGQNVPIRAVSSFHEDQGETKIWRKNKRKSVTITLRLGNISIDDFAERTEAFFRGIDFPQDTIYGFGEEYKRLRESQREMLGAVGLSVLILYMLLAALFESVRKPLLILLPLPLTIAGVIFLLAALRMSLSMGAYIGMIMLGGIATNNAILLVSTIFRRVDHLDLQSAALVRHVLSAASTRIRPILMTTITTALGMAPMIFDFTEGAAMWRPLAVTAASGLVVSLFVTLVLVPSATYHYILKMKRTKGVPG